MRPSLDFSDLAMEAGATCCIRMPLNRRQLLEAVNANLGPANKESMRGQATYPLKATQRAFQTIEPNGKTQSRACGTADVIGLENQPINLSPALQCAPNAISRGQGRLTSREREVLALVTDGVSNKAGGVRLSISVRTFETHRANVMGKLGAKNAAELVRFGLEGVRCLS
jgi:DNA-binding NarL/FixJ family response regulator